MVNLFAEAVLPLIAISAEVVGVLMPLVLAAIVAVAALVWREIAPHLAPASA